MNKKWVIVGVIVAGIFAGFFAFGKKENKSILSPYAKVIKVTRGPLVITVSSNGTVQPIDKVEVKSKASGQVLELPIEEGDFVRQGDVICRLDQTDTKSAYDQAKADLDVQKAALAQTENNTRRQEELFTKHLISDLEIDQARLDLVRAKSNLVRAQATFDNAEIKLHDTVVRSPITGVILTKNVEVGQIIASGVSNVGGGTLICTVADMQKVYISASVDETDIGKLDVGQETNVKADAYPDEKYIGKIIRIAPQAKVEQNVTTFEVIVLVDNFNGKLKSGMNAEIEVTTAQIAEALLVPVDALKEFRPGSMPGASADGAPSDMKKENVALNDTIAGQKGKRGFGRVPDGSESSPFTNRPAIGFGRSQNTGDISTLAAKPVKRKVVMVKDGADFQPRIVQIGASNFDVAQVLTGLQEGDEILVIPTSAAAKDRERFMERIRSQQQMGGVGAGRTGR